MALPGQPVSRPAVLAGTTNGKLSRSILSTTAGQNGGAHVTLVDPAARAWRALTAAAFDAGFLMTAATAARSYRSYSDQERIFRDRYYPSIFGTRRWNGQRWRKRSGVASAAVPGTSNHGWGLAVDASFSPPTFVWLKINAHRFGWSWEIQSESWHIRYWAGDDIPADVLEHEGTGDTEMILLHNTDPEAWYVTVPGVGKAKIDAPGHWADVIAEGRKTGTYTSPYFDELFTKIEAQA